MRTHVENDLTNVSNINALNNVFTQRNDPTDTMSDDYESDPKDNEQVSWKWKLAVIYFLMKTNDWFV